MGMNSSGSDRNVTSVLEAARRKLLETGTRNRLIHVNRANQRANCLNVINERSVEVYSQLLGGTRRMRFKAMGKDREAEDQDTLFDLPDDGQPVGAERHTDQYLETPLGPNALQRLCCKDPGGSARHPGCHDTDIHDAAQIQRFPPPQV
jgi:hypothetical protein